jgi:anthranilate synthase component 1
MGGLAGYLGFEASGLFETRLARVLGHSDLPDIALFAPRTILAFDNRDDRLHVTVLADRREGQAGLREAHQRMDELLDILDAPLPAAPAGSSAHDAPVLEPALSRDEFQAMVVRVQDEIRRGEAIQVVLSQAFSAGTSLDPFAVYQALRLVSPSPYRGRWPAPVRERPIRLSTSASRPSSRQTRRRERSI